MSLANRVVEAGWVFPCVDAVRWDFGKSHTDEWLAVANVSGVSEIAKPVYTERRAWRKDGKSVYVGRIAHILSRSFMLFVFA